MDYLENNNKEKTPLIKRVLSPRMALFVVCYAVYFLVTQIQLRAGDFLLQESGELDSVTSYDYILPIINSVVTVVTLGTFLIAGYFAYNRSKVKMLRFPMAFCFSNVVGSFFSTLFTAVYATPFIDFSEGAAGVMGVLSSVTVAVKLISGLAFFIYFDGEKESNYYYDDDDYYSENPSSRSFRDKVLSHRFSVFITVMLVSLGTEIAGSLINSGLTAIIAFVPDSMIWISNYIEVLSYIISYALYILLSWYFAREIRTSLKLVGLIVMVGYAMNSFSFVFNSITNAFSQAGEHLLNSIFSMVFVSIAAFIVSVIKLIVLVTLCHKLKKSREQREYN